MALCGPSAFIFDERGIKMICGHPGQPVTGHNSWSADICLVEYCVIWSCWCRRVGFGVGCVRVAAWGIGNREKEIVMTKVV